jgi:hypothetical protein
VSSGLIRIDRATGPEVLVVQSLGLRDSSGYQRLRDVNLTPYPTFLLRLHDPGGPEPCDTKE